MPKEKRSSKLRCVKRPVVQTISPRKIRRGVMGGRVLAACFVGLASSMVGDMSFETKVDGILGHADAGEISCRFHVVRHFNRQGKHSS